MRLLHPPAAAWRWFIAVIGVVTLASNVALLLSDRAPSVLRALFGDVVRRATERLDAGGRADAALSARDVGSDSIVHFGLWATATIIVGLAAWSWIGLLAASGAVGLFSIATELAQGRYSTSRAVERSDAAFNLLGVGAGIVAVAVIYVCSESVARLVRRAR